MEPDEDIRIVEAADPIKMMAELASKVVRDFLAEGRNVLLLLPGNKSVALAPLLGSHLADYENHKLTVSLTDEVYVTSPSAPSSYGGGVVRAGLANTLLSTGAKWEAILHGQSLPVESRTMQHIMHQAQEQESAIVALLTIDEFGGIAGMEPDDDVGRFHERFASDQLAIGYRTHEGVQKVGVTLSGLHAADTAIVLAPNLKLARAAATAEDTIHENPSTVCQELIDVTIIANTANA